MLSATINCLSPWGLRKSLLKRGFQTSRKGHEPHVQLANHLSRSSSLNEADYQDDNGNNQQDMNKITYSIATNKTQQPQNYQYDSDRP